MNYLKFLYPFGLIYGTITWCRNKLFDWGILKQITFDIPIISIGNLSLGGTGKTPLIEYFITKYGTERSTAMISRGYGRKSKGFRYVNANDKTETCGDEPLQIKQKFPEVCVAVSESRALAVQTILSDYPEINLILLDDAFQHRYVKPSLNILLTEYSKPFWKDFVVPAGRLREFRCGWKRADAIVITKCPEFIDLKIPRNIQTKPVYYSKINYQKPVIINGQLSKSVILVTGIANAFTLVEYLTQTGCEILFHFNFSDHYDFKESDISDILSKAGSEKNALILTTEKDWMRLNPFLKNQKLNIAYIPISAQVENAPDWLNQILPE